MRAVIFREGPCWLAQVLDQDIGAQGDNLKDLLHRLDRAMEVDGLAGLAPAPRYFQDLWPLRAGDLLVDQPLVHLAGMTFGVVA